jgi:hypothetical protein
MAVKTVNFVRILSVINHIFKPTLAYEGVNHKQYSHLLIHQMQLFAFDDIKKLTEMECKGMWTVFSLFLSVP